MRIAYYCPMKSPNHPTPSGDRLMAHQLSTALMRGGNSVSLASEFRSFQRDHLPMSRGQIDQQAAAERDRIAKQWETGGKPDLWFTYHPYYKAPDLLGVDLTKQFGIPYVTAETSYSARRNVGIWELRQAQVLQGILHAAVNICFTSRDSEGILGVAPQARVAMLPPFIEATPFLDVSKAKGETMRLVTVAMMRGGDKSDSYAMLADALARLPSDLPWRLSIVGDGPMQIAIQGLFSNFPPDRITWHGQLSTAEIISLLSKSSVFVWPGYGEAYGLAYLEAQAVGLPVVAQSVAGVPDVVKDGVTGLLTRPADPVAFAQAIAQILTQPRLRERLSTAAREWVRTQRSLRQAAIRLDSILTAYCKRTT